MVGAEGEAATAAGPSSSLDPAAAPLAAKPRLGMNLAGVEIILNLKEQLKRLRAEVDVLTLTATPIPRTLAMTFYADLDVSVIDEMPAGRGQIKTFVRPADKLPKVWAFIRDKLAEGRQAYVVYPRVEDTGERDLKAVKKDLKEAADEMDDTGKKAKYLEAALEELLIHMCLGLVGYKE